MRRAYVRSRTKRVFDRYYKDSRNMVGKRRQALSNRRCCVVVVRRVTLEPGGQIELSGAPLATLHETAEELDAFLKDLSPEVGGSMQSEVAMRPDFYPDQVAWMPRERHQLSVFLSAR